MVIPGGTVTMLLTDIEDSSSQWETAPNEMRAALALHDTVVRQVIDHRRGHIVKHLGDGCWAAFDSAPNAADAAIEILQRLQGQPDDVRRRLRMRIGLHTGDVQPTDGDYFGPVPNRAARIADLANGNQIVCSTATAGLLDGFTLRSEGIHEMRGIGQDEVFMLLAPSLQVDPRPLRRSMPRSNLPKVHTSFMGRAGDASRVVEFLQAGCSVVTLIGPGGVGKTRLAIAVGEDLAADATTVVQFCELDAVAAQDATAVAASIANQLGARQQPDLDLIDSIADYVSGRELLIILDNCEHVLGAVAELVTRLAGLDGVRILATSRSALGVSGEQLMSVEPLTPETVGVDLFVSRALQRDATFALTDENRHDVLEIARRLDGIPLAIELAAARIRLMTPGELVAGLDDRFALLSGPTGRRRQETLRGTIEWSYQLLSAPEAAVFSRMSVFAGGATLRSIGAVCADGTLVLESEIPDLVLALVDKSMVVSAVDEGHRRFRLLETMREFGDEVLTSGGERSTYRRAHAAFMAHVASSENARIFTPSEPDAWRVLDREWANLRTALDSFEEQGELDSSVELVIDLAWYAVFGMRYELFAWAEELLGAAGIDAHPSYVDLCGLAAIGAYFTVSGRATELAEAGLAAEPEGGNGFCRTALAAEFLNNRFTRAASDALTAEWLDSQPGSTGSQLWAEGFRTFHLFTYGTPDEARPHAAATAAIAQQTGSITAHALAAWAQGMLLASSDVDGAVATWTAGLEWPRSMPRDHLLEPLLDGLLLHFTVAREPLPVVLRHCRSALRAAVESHYYVGVSHLFGVTAIALTRSGDPETGARLVGSMLAHGHRPRVNAREALSASLGADVERFQELGKALSITSAAQLAVTALDAALARVGSEAG